MIDAFLEILRQIYSENPTLYAVAVVLIILVEGTFFALLMELVFKILGVEVKETPHH
ncbi:hypothetical protein [Candidatus Pyrohabitans sp.]